MDVNEKMLEFDCGVKHCVAEKQFSREWKDFTEILRRNG